MSPSRGVQRRPDNAPTVLMQGRVSPEARAAVQEAARASGVSVSFYLDAFIKNILRETGELPRVQPPKPQKETLM